MIQSKLPNVGTTIFTRMSQLAAECGAINLSQGFPDFDGPPELREAVGRHIAAGHNQYAPMTGLPALREQVAKKIEQFYGRRVSADSEVTITPGATEAIFSAIQALVHPGDEVVVLDPSYDSYEPSVQLAGGRCVHVPLALPDFSIDWQRMAEAIGPRTRLVIINTPHNPSGALISREELDRLAALIRDRDIYLISDEVYEHLRYAGGHRPLAALPGAFERTLTVSSVGKSFSVTGWRVGWVSGPAHLVGPVRATKAYLTHSAATPLQIGAATALGLPDGFYDRLTEDFRRRRDVLVRGLAAAGAEPFEPQGTFFVVADVRGLCERYGVEDAAHLAPVLAERAGVVGVPVPALASAEHRERYASWMRFSFGKRLDVLERAGRQLAG